MQSQAIHRLVFSVAFLTSMAIFAAVGARSAQACCPPAPDDTVEWVSSALNVYPVAATTHADGGYWRHTAWADEYRPGNPAAAGGFVTTWTARYRLYDGTAHVQRAVVGLDGVVSLTPNPPQYDHCWTRFINLAAPTMSTRVECGRAFPDRYAAPVSIWKGDCGTTLESVDVETQQFGLARAFPQPVGGCDEQLAQSQPLRFEMRYAPPWNRSLEEWIPLHFSAPLY